MFEPKWYFRGGGGKAGFEERSKEDVGHCDVEGGDDAESAFAWACR